MYPYVLQSQERLKGRSSSAERDRERSRSKEKKSEKKREHSEGERDSLHETKRRKEDESGGKL